MGGAFLSRSRFLIKMTFSNIVILRSESHFFTSSSNFYQLLNFCVQFFGRLFKNQAQPLLKKNQDFAPIGYSRRSLFFTFCLALVINFAYSTRSRKNLLKNQGTLNIHSPLQLHPTPHTTPLFYTLLQTL